MTTITNTPAHDQTAPLSLPRILLHVEGAAIFFGCIALYAHLGGSALLFILLLLAPDVSGLGYLINQRVGALLYNIVHLYALPLIVGILALLSGWQLGILLALIWGAHIGLDRTVGYGMKYTTNAKDTHLRRL